MDPAYLLNNLDPANKFMMGCLNMAFTSNLTQEGKPLPKTLFIGIMTEKNRTSKTFTSGPIFNGQ